MSTYGERLLQAMEATPPHRPRKITRKELSQAVGISPQAVGQVIKGASGAFTSQNHEKAVGLLKCSGKWLATGIGHMWGTHDDLVAAPEFEMPKFLRREPAGEPAPALPHFAAPLDGPRRPSYQNSIREPSNVESAPKLRDPRRIPVRGEVKGGDDGFLEELSYAEDDGYVESQSSDPDAYALRVRGDSMHPRYRAGEFIVVEPGIEAQPGDDVVVALKDGRKLLKELNWIRDGEVQLLSVNNHFAPLTLQLSEVLHIHLAAHRVRRNAFLKNP